MKRTIESTREPASAEWAKRPKKQERMKKRQTGRRTDGWVIEWIQCSQALKLPLFSFSHGRESIFLNLDKDCWRTLVPFLCLLDKILRHVLALDWCKCVIVSLFHRHRKDCKVLTQTRQTNLRWLKKRCDYVIKKKKGKDITLINE